MKRIQNKKHKIGTYEIKKHRYCVLMIKDLFQMMVFICLLIFIKTVKIKRCAKRFLQMTINKKRFSQIRRVQKDYHKKEDSHR